MTTDNLENIKNWFISKWINNHSEMFQKYYHYSMCDILIDFDNLQDQADHIWNSFVLKDLNLLNNISDEFHGYIFVKYFESDNESINSDKSQKINNLKEQLKQEHDMIIKQIIDYKNSTKKIINELNELGNDEVFDQLMSSIVCII